MLDRFKPLDLCVFAGAALMVLGTFLPIVTFPIIGSINYLAGGRGDGMIVLVLALVIAGLAAAGYRKLTTVAAILALAVMLTTIVKMTSVFHDLHSNLASLQKDNPFGAGLAQLASASVGYGFGWVPLFGGAFLVLGAGVAGWQGSIAGFADRAAKDGAHQDEDKPFDADAAVARYLQRQQPEGPRPETVAPSQRPLGTSRFGRRTAPTPL
jgi:hypothetical protein